MGKMTVVGAIEKAIKEMKQFTTMELYEVVKLHVPTTTFNSVSTALPKQFADDIETIGKKGRYKIFRYIGNSPKEKLKTETEEEPEPTITTLQIGKAIISLLEDKNREIAKLKREVDSLREQRKGERAHHHALERTLKETIETLKNQIKTHSNGFPLEEVARFIK